MNFNAIFPPMPTPLVDDAVDARGIASNIEKWVRAGVGGVVALGSNGEAPLLDDDESDRVVAAARDALPSGKLLIAGTGRESTRAAIAASRRAASLGADAVLVAHYTAVADACPVPVLIYNVPAVTGLSVTVDAVARLSQHPNIPGMKESGTDTGQVAAFVSAGGPGFSVIAGTAPTFYPSLCVGAVGGILAVACVVPDLCVRLLDLVIGGRHAEARDVQKQITPIAALVTTAGGVPALKAAMEIAGFTGGSPRLPLLPASSETVDRIRVELSRVRGAATVLSQ